MKAASLKYRAGLPDSRRIVIKIGSRVLVQRSGRPDRRRMAALTAEIALLRKRGHEIAVVTSGAVGAGMEALGMKARPVILPEVQMCAAIGQTRLMSRYDALFAAKGIKVGQVLLTHDDFQYRLRQTNARRTIETLLRRGVIPIINENDVVSDEELKADLAFADNDFLAALVVKLIRADLLVLLTTVDGVREPDGHGRTRRIRFLDQISRKTLGVVRASTESLSKGGMGSKLQASQAAAASGCSVVIANGRDPGVLARVVAGEDIGTLVVPSAL
ncbi:MAG: glutamate 5-kinase [Kiritimatiellia bacterium]